MSAAEAGVILLAAWVAAFVVLLLWANWGDPE
jgi:hypothetical protein